jgi:hypothetical protein
LRSKAGAIDKAGYLVESVSVDIEDPVAPPRTARQKQSLLRRYLPAYYVPPPDRKRAARQELKLF